MSITTPAFYPQPWAANEQLVPLTPAEMAAGYPSGSDEKPSRQSINNALQYAVNGVLYYLTTGIPAWSATAVYQMGAIVVQGGRYYASLVDGGTNQPPPNAAWTELLWLQSVLDARYAVLNGSVAFAACAVANSPVRTFANSPEGGQPGGMQWPPAGVAISTGTAWSESFDPATLATWPATGIPVSTGTAWGASIDPATIPLLNVDNIFAADQTFSGNVHVMKSLYVGPNATSGVAQVILDAAGNADGSGKAARLLSTHPSSAALVGALSLGGHSADGSVAQTYLNCAYSATNGVQVSVPGTFFITPDNGTYAITSPATPGLVIGWNLTNGVGETDFINTKAAALGGFNWYNVPSGVTVPGSTPTLMALSATGLLTLSSGVRIGPRTPVSVWQSGSANINADTGNLCINGPSGAGVIYLGFDQGTGGVKFGNGAGTAVATVDSVGNIGTGGGVYASTMVTAGQTGAHDAAASGASYSCSIYNTLDGPNRLTSRFVAVGDGGSRGIISLCGVGQPASPAFMPFLTLSDSGITAGANLPVSITGTLSVPTINLNGSAITIGQKIGSSFGTTMAEFRTDNSLPRTYIDAWGDLYINSSRGTGHSVVVSGTLTATTKNFRIPHPLDDSKYLTHSSLEGPEIAVFYRGESVTVNGVVEIALPDYFEALTFPEERTVHLTELYEDEANPVFGNFIAAGRVKDGKFTVRSSTENVKFYWEVKAVRRLEGDERLVTETLVADDPYAITIPVQTD